MAAGHAEELNDFIQACARAGVNTVHVPLDIFISWAEVVRPSKDEIGAHLALYNGAIVVRPVTGVESFRSFESADEVLAFIEAHRNRV